MLFFQSLWNKLFKKKPSGVERRKFIRLSAHHLLKYKMVDKDKVVSFARNISAGGVLFYSKQEMAKGDHVEMDISFPGYQGPVKVVAKVIRINPLKHIGGFEIGAEFISVAEGAKDFINKKIVTVSSEISKAKSRKS